MSWKEIKESIQKKVNKQSVKGFLQKQGLYVLIFLCIAAAGITAIIAWPKAEVAEPQTSESDQNVAAIEAPNLGEELAVASQTPIASPTAQATPQPTSTKPAASSNGSGKITLKKPIDGQVINAFSGDALVYFASMNMWATHNGVDIKAEKDAEVVAALSGTVTEVYSNEAEGGVVVISHSDTAKTVYAGLGETLVEAGAKVNAGQTIGKVGEMPEELDLSYHLHFEYIVGDSYRNAANYF
jgi:murein DD-endopeptidase MepM/ murein hydrolase activator NlpD